MKFAPAWALILGIAECVQLYRFYIKQQPLFDITRNFGSSPTVHDEKTWAFMIGILAIVRITFALRPHHGRLAEIMGLTHIAEVPVMTGLWYKNALPLALAGVSSGMSLQQQVLQLATSPRFLMELVIVAGIWFNGAYYYSWWCDVSCGIERSVSRWASPRRSVSVASEAEEEVVVEEKPKKRSTTKSKSKSKKR